MKTYNSLTSSMRHVRLIDKSVLSNNKMSNKINKKLTLYIGSPSGRNNSGHITVFTKSSVSKRLYRIIDYNRHILNVPGVVYSIHYDPNRSSFISLILYKNNITCYILGVLNLNIGETIVSYRDYSHCERSYNKGDCNQLIYLPISTSIHNLEL